MFKLDRRLLVLVLVLGMLLAIFGCSQTDDVTAPISMTKVQLTANRLPTPVPGMAYELWASKVDYREIADQSQVASLGQFSYLTSDTLVSFLEPGLDTVVRADGNLFTLDDDVFSYAYLLVTVEVLGAVNATPGPVVVQQRITGQADTIWMYSPLSDSLFEAIVRCNFETPTDGNSFGDGYGLWFCNYERGTLELVDTNGVTIEYVWDTLEVQTNEYGDTINFPTLYAPYPDTVWVEFDTIMYDFGQDSLPLGVDSIHFFHNGATQYILYEIDSTLPRIVKNFDGLINYDLYTHYIDLDVFSQDMYALPDPSPYGWKYKGWVVSNNIDPAAVGSFSPPAWDFISGDLLIPGYDGGLLTTGTFTQITQTDDSNPMTLEIPWEVDSGSFIDTVLLRPSFPGEDFIDPAAISAATNGVYNAPINLLPNFNNSESGTILISLEPDNMVTETTNFPLIPFGMRFPMRWPVPHPSGATFTIWTMFNWSGSAPGTNGFPKITAEFERL
jgi:hypothetical protein